GEEGEDGEGVGELEGLAELQPTIDKSARADADADAMSRRRAQTGCASAPRTRWSVPPLRQQIEHAMNRARERSDARRVIGRRPHRLRTARPPNRHDARPPVEPVPPRRERVVQPDAHAESTR